MLRKVKLISRRFRMDLGLLMDYFVEDISMRTQISPTELLMLLYIQRFWEKIHGILNLWWSRMLREFILLAWVFERERCLMLRGESNLTPFLSLWLDSIFHRTSPSSDLQNALPSFRIVSQVLPSVNYQSNSFPTPTFFQVLDCSI